MMDGYEGEDDWEFGDPTWEPVDWRQFWDDLGCSTLAMLGVVGVILSVAWWVGR